MEIRQVLRGQNTSFAQTRQAGNGNQTQTTSARPAADRLELSQQWVEAMEEQRIQAQTALLGAQDKEKKSNGILDMLDGPTAESEELDALSRQLDVQMKCMKIAANIMKGKKVPPEDERYLMENDPSGYKLAIATRPLARDKDDKECESVLDDEDKESGEASAQAGDTAGSVQGGASAAPDALSVC